MTYTALWKRRVQTQRAAIVDAINDALFFTNGRSLFRLAEQLGFTRIADIARYYKLPEYKLAPVLAKHLHQALMNWKSTTDSRHNWLMDVAQALRVPVRECDEQGFDGPIPDDEVAQRCVKRLETGVKRDPNRKRWKSHGVRV